MSDGAGVSGGRKTGPSDLSPTMKRHLRELQEIAAENYGEAAWGPASAGEWRCAEALERRGLLSRNVERGRRPFSLTEAGRSFTEDSA